MKIEGVGLIRTGNDLCSCTHGVNDHLAVPSHRSISFGTAASAKASCARSLPSQPFRVEVETGSVFIDGWKIVQHHVLVSMNVLTNEVANQLTERN
jgi:hypothetical protein